MIAVIPPCRYRPSQAVFPRFSPFAGPDLRGILELCGSYQLGPAIPVHAGCDLPVSALGRHVRHRTETYIPLIRYSLCTSERDREESIQRIG